MTIPTPDKLRAAIALLPTWKTMSWARGCNEFTINRAELETIIAALEALPTQSAAQPVDDGWKMPEFDHLSEEIQKNIRSFFGYQTNNGYPERIYGSIRATLLSASPASSGGERRAVLEEAAKECDAMGVREQDNYGSVRSAHNYFRASRAIRALAAISEPDVRG